jgi:hypothetical protein
VSLAQSGIPCSHREVPSRLRCSTLFP